MKQNVKHISHIPQDFLLKRVLPSKDSSLLLIKSVSPSQNLDGKCLLKWDSGGNDIDKGGEH